MRKRRAFAVAALSAGVQDHGPSRRREPIKRHAPAPASPGPVGQFTDAKDALACLRDIYDRNTGFLRDRFTAYTQGDEEGGPNRAHYPYVRLTTRSSAAVDTRLAYGFVGGPGAHATTVTRPDLYERYLSEQLTLLLRNHGVPLEIGVSDEPIPIHFAFPQGLYVEGDLPPDRLTRLPDLFDLPDLARMDDTIVNGVEDLGPDAVKPLALFTAPRVDFSLHRLRHYTATAPSISRTSSCSPTTNSMWTSSSACRAR